MSAAFDNLDDDIEWDTLPQTSGSAATEFSAQAGNLPPESGTRAGHPHPEPPPVSLDPIPIEAYAEEIQRIDSEPYITPEWVRRPEANTESNWPDPRDLASKIYEGAPFNPDWLPGQIADYVSDVAERMGGDPGAPAMGVIAACCGVADDGFHVTPKLHDTGWRERACVWTLAVGLSASKKTWLLESALKPITRMDAAITKAYLEKLDQWNYDMEAYAEVRKRAIKNGEPRPEAPEKPQHEHLMVNEFTIEAVREALMDSPRGILVYRDEFAGLIKDMDRYSAKASGDRFSILELHNGGTKKIGRVGNFKTVPNWSAPITGCLTPSSLKSITGDLQEDGLLQRFLICMVKPAGIDQDRAPNAQAEAAYLRVLNELRAMRAIPGQNDRIRFTPEAYACRMEFMETATALATAEGIPGAMAAHIRKFEAAFPRLCCAFHLMGLAVMGQHPNANEVITLAEAEQVRDLLLWQHSHIEEFWLETLGDGGDNFAMKIANHILAHGIEILHHNKDIAEPYFKQWKALSDREKTNAYATLENAGWIVRLPDAKQNIDRIWSKWQVNPFVHKKFAEQARAEVKRRAEFRAKRERDLVARRAGREPGED